MRANWGKERIKTMDNTADIKKAVNELTTVAKELNKTLQEINKSIQKLSK